MGRPKTLEKTNTVAAYRLIDRCQICAKKIRPFFSLGHLPLVDALKNSRRQAMSQPRYPTPLLYCFHCQLLQLGCLVDPETLFPPDYPYTSATTKILCDNFAQLAQECRKIISLGPSDLVVDIGCNDGTLLGYFKGRCRLLGITPERIGKLAEQKGIEVLRSYFTSTAVTRIVRRHGRAKLITATNVLAHIPDVHAALNNILDMLMPKGIFVSESGYLAQLWPHLQYDSIHHEHLRYYSLTSLDYLFRQHGMEIIHAKLIAPHGGSIRVYAARQGQYPASPEIKSILKEEKKHAVSAKRLKVFGKTVMKHSVALRTLLFNLSRSGRRIYGIGAPGRASVLLNYAGIDQPLLDCIVEVRGSHKIGKYVPGTSVPILEEKKLYTDPPDYALVLSWHFAQALMRKAKKQGFRGDFIVPLPKPLLIRRQDIQ